MGTRWQAEHQGLGPILCLKGTKHQEPGSNTIRVLVSRVSPGHRTPGRWDGAEGSSVEVALPGRCMVSG